MDHLGLPNPDLLERLPWGARVVLDVGCAAGALGVAHRRRNPAARVFGIEKDRRLAALASATHDPVFVADLDDDPLPFADHIRPGEVDALIYGDVLQCLRSPTDVLRAHLPYLADDGVTLLCIPNLEHWSFVDALLGGTWDCEASGLFDTRHLRWFTRPMVERMLRRLGLHSQAPKPRVFDRGAAETFAGDLRPALQRRGIDPGDYMARATPLRHVWCATRSPVRRLPVISNMLTPVGGVSDVRVTQPMAALAGEPSLNARVVHLGAQLPAPDEPPGIFIMHRPALFDAPGLQPIRELIARGWLVVCEFDDNPDFIPGLSKGLFQNFRAVHAVQTSTERLAERFRTENPEVAIFPNAIARVPDVVNFRDPNRLTLLFAGINRESEWQEYLGALNNAAFRAGDRLHFVIVGDRLLHEHLRTPHKQLLPRAAYDIYQSLLSACEISFMPLRDTPFNRCKSDLKFLEAAAHRAVPLASSVVYEDSIVDGHTGILFHDPLELEQRLLRLVVDPAAGRTIADTARTHVLQNRMLAGQVAARVRWYHSLWERREELHASLLARVPELWA
jgi:hypothetical protein